MIKSTCKSCHGSCGVIATVENGRLTHLEGNPESPTWGTMCAKGLSSIQEAYNRLGIEGDLEHLLAEFDTHIIAIAAQRKLSLGGE
jgi:hypothetical protein